MGVERLPGGSNLIDVLDRILEKGIVMDVWTKVSKSGIDLVHSKARVVVTSMEIRLKHADRIGPAPTAFRSQPDDPNEAGWDIEDSAPRQPDSPRMHRAASRR